MEELKNIETYTALISNIRKRGGKFTNNNIVPKDIKRFIDLKRIRYVSSDDCLVFILDEEKYYRLLLHMNPDKEWELPELDKPMLVRAQFVKGKKKPDLVEVERKMQEKGFVLKDTNVQIAFDIPSVRDLCRQKYLRSKKILEYYNLQIIKADYSYYNQIKGLLKNQDMIQYFHIPYQTEDEIESGFENGNYVAIINENNEVLAYTSGHPGIAGVRYAEAMVIQKEYKLYGFAPILFYYCMSNTKAVISKSSVGLHNSVSIKLHEKLGWEFSDRYIEHWLKE